MILSSIEWTESGKLESGIFKSTPKWLEAQAPELKPCFNPLTISLTKSAILIAGGDNQFGKSSHAFVLHPFLEDSSHPIADCSFAFTSEGIHICPTETNPVAKFIAHDELGTSHIMAFDSRTETFEVIETLAPQNPWVTN